MKKPINNNTVSYLEERIKHLEGVERFVIDSLEVAASLGDFQSSINKLHDVTTILEETRIKVQGLIPFETVAFFLVDEESNDFTLRHIDSENHRSYIQREVDNSIDSGIFAWALTEKRPVIVPTQDHQKYLVLHSMATATRIRGMFIGLLNNDAHGIQNVSLSLVSLILFNSANTIESFELYRKIREINTNLERIDNYRLLFEAAPDGVEVVDTGGNIIDSNDSQKKLLGYSQKQLTGSLSSNYFSEKSRASGLNNPSSLNENGYWEGEVELVTATGELVPVWRKEKAIYDNDHRFIGAVVYNRDITERKQAEEEKQSLEERLQRSEKMEALGTLAGGVAHDLNNVLGIVVGYAEMTLDEIDKSSPLRPGLVNIMNAGMKAAAIVDDLLTLARRGVSGRSILNLNKIIADCQKSPEFANLSVHHPFVKIKTDLEPDLPNVSGSSVHLVKSLYNLVSNASEAMAKGGGVTIKTSNQYLDKPIQGYDKIREGDYVVLSVSDTGEGISANDRKRIFEPFYTKKIMGRSGTGLGLAVVWGTVKDHHGYINIQSEKGKGSTFTIYFPVAREAITAEAVAVAISEYIGKRDSILVVDDVKEQRDLAARMLRTLNYNVSSVSSGEEAVAYMKEHHVDLMVLDMIMDPGMDGLDTYKKVLEIHPKQKAIIVSGFSESDRVKTAEGLGAGAYVRKPYIKEKLGVAVRKELDRAA